MPYKILNENCLYKGFIELEELEIKENGESYTRLVIDRPPAMAILIYVKDTDEIVFVEQLRAPLIKQYENEAYLLELPAGSLEEGENTAEGIKRETLEETGFKVSDIQKVGEAYASPGILSEKLHIYYTEALSSDRIEKGGGLESESEFLKIKLISRERVFEMMDSFQIIDAKSLIGLQWFRYNFSR